MKINFMGNIGKDAQLRKVQNGDRQDSVLSIWVAENKKRRNGDERTVWHKVTIWRGYAESMAKHLKSGRKIWVEGTAEAKFYTDSNNCIVPYIDVQADKITLLDHKPDEDVPPETDEEGNVVEGAVEAKAEDVTEEVAEEMPW